MANAAARYRLLIKIGLGVYAFICLVLFIWIRFPYDSLKYKVEDTLTDVIGSQVMLGHIHPNLLWGFTIDGLEIKGVPVAKKVTITPRPWDIFWGGLGFGFHVDFVSGMTDGHIRLPFKKSKRPMNITLDMTNVDLSGFSKVFPPSMTLKGSMSGELNLTTPRDSLDKATGNLALTWKKGTLPLGMEMLPFDALVFDNLELDGKIDNGLLSLEKAEFTGEFSGAMNGNIRFSSSMKRSRLAITGELTLPESMKKALGPEYDSSGQGNRFSLRGSIERPRFRMAGAPGRRMPAVPVQDVGANSQVQQSPERHQPERAKQEAAAPGQGPVSIDRRSPDRSVPDDTQGDKAIEPEGQ